MQLIIFIKISIKVLVVMLMLKIYLTQVSTILYVLRKVYQYNWNRHFFDSEDMSIVYIIDLE